MATAADTNHATIAERVAELQSGVAGHLPDDVRNAFNAEQADLRAGGVPGGVAAPGDTMPDAQLLDVHGAPTTLAEVVRGRVAVVVLYRGASCPFCNLTLRAYQEDLVPQLSERGHPLASAQPAKARRLTVNAGKERPELCRLVRSGQSDSHRAGVLTTPSDDVRAAQRTLDVDLSEVNADGTHGIPMPTVVIVDGAGSSAR